MTYCKRFLLSSSVRIPVIILSEDDNRNYRNVGNMSSVSIALAVLLTVDYKSSLFPSS